MKILVTGNRGYIGTVLVDMLHQAAYEVVGLDTDFFNGCELGPYDQSYPQIRKDIRSVGREDIEGIDAVIHLAALSNDPLGELAPDITDEINFRSTVRLAVLCKEIGVKRFVYASSQSMYGIADIDVELDEENSEKNPLTAYAKAKWEAEVRVREMGSEEFVVTCFRPSTVFGSSPKLRCDVVFNNLVACAYTTGKIEIKSDGTPWRPVVHVCDVGRAFIAGLEAPEQLVSGQSFNVGIRDGNFTIREIAEAAQRAVPGSELVFTNEHTDPRTYRVSFQKILTGLKEYFLPEWDLDRGGADLVEFFGRVGFTEDDFRGNSCNRLQQLDSLMQSKLLTGRLTWAQMKE